MLPTGDPYKVICLFELCVPDYDFMLCLSPARAMGYKYCSGITVFLGPRAKFGFGVFYERIIIVITTGSRKEK